MTTPFCEMDLRPGGIFRTAMRAPDGTELVRIKLEFFKPMQGISTADFILKPESTGTSVTWSIYGDNSFMAKAFCLFMNQDKMIGGPFEKGLADLKVIVEAETRQ